MPRTIILDANVLDQINRGNAGAATKLLELQKAGHRIWVAHQTYEELVVQPFIPRTRVANGLLLGELRIPLAPPGKMSERVSTYDRNPPKSGLSAEKDVMIAGQAVASKAEVWSFDKAFRNNHAQLLKVMGVQVAPESYTIPLSNDVADYRVGRRLLGLPPVKISLSGNITTIGPRKPSNLILASLGLPTKPSGGAGAAGAKKPQSGTLLAPVVLNAPGRPGDAVFGGITVYLQGIGLVLNMITDEINERRCNEALAARQGEIEKYARKHPEEGTLIVLYFERLLPAPGSLSTPRPVFDHLRVYHGRNLAMAKEAWQNTPDISRSAGPDRVWETDLIWIEPLAPRPIRAEELRLPFPVVALARFAAGRIRFRDVEFGGVTGFDDSGQTVLSDEVSTHPVISFLEELATAFMPFYVLRPPNKLPWVLHGQLQETSISLVSRMSNNGVPVDSIDLDPYMLGDVAAAMIFPAHDLATNLFRHSPAIDDNLNLLRGIPNVHLLRFVEPSNLWVSTD